ncbi:LOG family protein [Parachitinimonas caeni]|uniref:Cytokinin riboside 5'-monophosphate phosphoribohydrolase n=1 Tax=Parachitinimonas caeni TaxID=3031301 RepID=A0ABT7E103_9NEIS|nr:TIGR00730 family Rossman fold protein [Parachitinimonas caeni]MDK2125998.1 TIGR00730 family Rossman fold protein [Parachitinimonas caeni]
MKKVCVFCGSRDGAKPEYVAAARALGAELARRDLALVYGGGKVGLMGVIADAVLEAGGKVYGVMTEFLVAREVAHYGLTELQVVKTMHERKALMAEMADGFIAMPGGFGTFDELFEIITWAQLGVHSKPIALLNTSGYFNPLLQMVDHAIAEDFVRPEQTGLLLRSDEISPLLDAMTNHQAPVVEVVLEAKQI